MIIKKRKVRAIDEVSTASLPDIVFMLLFFFMVTTVMQDEKPTVRLIKPTAAEIEKVEQKDLSCTIYVGYKSGESIPTIEADGQNMAVNRVAAYVAEKRAELPEVFHGKFMTIIKADRSLPMELITQVKQELREVQAYKIQYSTLPK